MSYQISLRVGEPDPESTDEESAFEAESFLTSSRFLRLYPDTTVVLARRGTTLAARWLVPRTGGRALSRPFRLLPYTPISFHPGLHESERRSCTAAIADWLTGTDSGIDAIELPLAPHSPSTAPFADVGVRIGYRQTYLVSLERPWERAFSPTCQNNIRRAEGVLQVRFGTSFDCTRGVTRESGSAWASRAQLVRQLTSTGRAAAATAYRADGETVGQGFLAWDRSTAYLLHNWRLPDAPRGTMNLIIATLMRRAGQIPGLRHFDLEGSVVAGVDRFYSTFGAEPVGYPWLSWARLPD